MIWDIQSPCSLPNYREDNDGRMPEARVDHPSPGALPRLRESSDGGEGAEEEEGCVSSSSWAGDGAAPGSEHHLQPGMCRVWISQGRILSSGGSTGW